MRLAAIILPMLLVLAGAASAAERPFDGRWGFDAESLRARARHQRPRADRDRQ